MTVKMNNIDFNKIRAWQGSQEAAFEELVCMLARREVVSSGAEFRRIEGRGGDGGVEALWRAKNGSERGYQAKFFLASHEVKWAQIDASVDTALKTHRKIREYVIALACTLTDKTARPGKSGWERWREHKQKWEKAAIRITGHRVKFIPWTASELHDKLVLPTAAGLRHYWFGALELSDAWFEHHTRRAVAELDERYHPEDHVDISAQELFDIISRAAAVRDGLRRRLSDIRKHTFSRAAFSRLPTKPSASLVAAAERALRSLTDIEAAFDAPVDQQWPGARWSDLAGAARGSIEQLHTWSWQQEAKAAEAGKPADEFRLVSFELGKVRSSLDGLIDYITRPEFAVESTRAALLHGRAGSGKSHTMARAAEAAIAEHRPVLLIVGLLLQHQPIWSQVLERFGLANTPVLEFLDALNVAAAASRTRALVLVDGINEGPGASLWMNELGGMLEQLRAFDNLACVVSCRTEYLDYIVPPRVRAKLPMLEIRGFETPDEQRDAARTYLDRRGIARPATPWLAPEFINPLFLRSVCESLKRAGLREFPRGLIGTKKILAFYLDTVATQLGFQIGAGMDLIGPVKATLTQIAYAAASKRQDYISRGEAEAIVATAFQGCEPPPGYRWLQLLQRTGLVRVDPIPSTSGDPLGVPAEAVRFSFQRFQDHLMAEAMLASIPKQRVTAEFADGGRLAFIRRGNTSLAGEWMGLVEALAIQVPEQYGLELIDLLPGSQATWWTHYHITETFVESVRWRDPAAFSPRTIDLLGELHRRSDHALRVLIELSCIIEHPWNARFLHKLLVRRPMHERDAFWSSHLSRAASDESHPAYRLIDWCLDSQAASAPHDTQALCALTLCWFMTTSNREIRDRATKALTRLLWDRSELFPLLCESMAPVDDSYLHERMWAAAYGACCLDPREDRLVPYAQLAAANLFSVRPVRAGLLTRDYGRALVELALHHLKTIPGLDVHSCRPPYGCKIAALDVSEESLASAARAAGGDEIVGSCTGFIGDFGRYEIESALRHFSTVPLSHAPPYSRDELLQRFEREVVDPSPDRKIAFGKLRRAARSATAWDIHILGVPPGHRATRRKKSNRKTAASRWRGSATTPEGRFLKLLGAPERARYESDAKPALTFTIDKRETWDFDAARRWVAKRAYDLGWTADRFPDDHNARHGSRERSLVERIGKKYQWIALSELIASVADNFWLADEHGSGTRRYDSPLDVGFQRDIDPTVVPNQRGVANDERPPVPWMCGPVVVLDNVADKRLLDWPFLENPNDDLPTLIARRDPTGRDWLALYEIRHAMAYHDRVASQLDGVRQQAFRRVFTAIVKRGKVKRFVSHFRRKQNLDVMDWESPTSTDEWYLFELNWRPPRDDEPWRDDWRNAFSGIEVANLLFEYRWESHLDASLPRGASAHQPAQWLARKMGLAPLPSDASRFVAETGQCRFIGSSVHDDGSWCLIDAKAFRAFLKQESLDCVWIYVAERNALPRGREQGGAWRRAEGMCWFEGRALKTFTWLRDKRRS